MSLRSHWSFGLALAAAIASHGSAANAQLPGGVRAVPTYEAVGIYWSNPGAALAGGCEVRFRRAGESTWRQGLPLWFDARNNECRGSLVHLTQNTEYQVELNLPGQPTAASLSFRTWPDQRPVGARITVPSGSATLNITAGGSPLGYVVYEGAPGAVLDAANSAAHNVTINASYVIVRGLVLRGAQQDAIRISPLVTDVIIEDNEISGWGRQRSGNLGVEHDSAVRAVCPTPTLQRVTIQRNLIHDPRYTANSWSDGHPQGPQAVTFYNCGGNHVIRHNEIFSTTGRYYNDIIGGGPNDGDGFPLADTDIYGNELSHAWDDAIEAEGANTNVRIWGNYIDRTGTGIATTPNFSGPLYAFRNVYNRSRLLERVPPDQDNRQVMFKAGASAVRGDGRRYIFHNTMLQAREPGSVHGLGASGGISGTGPTSQVRNTVSRNNIFHNWRSWTAYYEAGPGNDFGWDMFNGGAGAPVTNPIVATPVYAAGHGWQSEANGNYQLAPGTPGHDQGVRLPNFNDAYAGAAPDVGAHESGTPPMRFGLAASPGPAALPPPDPPRLANIATRGPVLTGEDVLIAGFIIGGSASKTIVVRARGPSLAAAGLGGTLANPQLQLVRSADGATIAVNDDWQVAPNAAQLAASGFAPPDSREAAVLVTLAPGAYTAIVSGVGSTTGLGIVEVFEAADRTVPLTNIATRGRVLTGNDVLIGGFIIQGSGPLTVVVRARGPSLAAAGVADELPNPILRLVRSSDGATLAINDDWGVSPNAAAVAASGFAPPHPAESAILMTLDPGAYTAIVEGAGGTTGVGIVEVFRHAP